MQEIWDSILNIPYTIGYTILDFLKWVLSLFPSIPVDFQTSFDALSSDVVGMLNYVGFFAGLGIIATGFGIRAILMIFGR